MAPLLALFLAIVGLALGPILAEALAARRRLYAALDGFVLVVIGGLCLAHLLPHAFEAIGAWAVPLAAAGFVVPLLAERRLHRHQHGESPWFLAIALGGLLVHAALDGAALAVGGDGHTHAGVGVGSAHALEVSLAIVVHRLPVGLLIWWSVLPSLGARAAYLTLAGLAASTAFGFGLSPHVAPIGEGGVAAVIYALLAGGLLHVVMDHGPAPTGGQARSAGYSALGAALGVALFALLPLEPMPGADRSFAAIAHLFAESSPAILLGFLGAGLLSLVPSDTLSRLMTGKTVFTSALRGVVFGLPLPVCSCGVVPIYRGLMQKGIPPAAAFAFLIATPELGVDSILISVPLLGVELSIVRLVAALILALVAGVVAGKLTGEAPTPAEAPTGPLIPTHQGSPVRRAALYGFVTSVDDLGPWILAGLVVAGVMEPVLSEAWLAQVPAAAEVPLMAAIAAPFYVCASAATPVGAVFLAKGLAAGAVIAFLLTGPATNVTTYGAVLASHGRRTTLLLVGTVLGASVALGFVIQALSLGAGAGAAVAADHAVGVLGNASAVGFGLLLLGSFVRQGPRGFLTRLGLSHDHGTCGASPDACCAPAADPCCAPAADPCCAPAADPCCAPAGQGHDHAPVADACCGPSGDAHTPAPASAGAGSAPAAQPCCGSAAPSHDAGHDHDPAHTA